MPNSRNKKIWISATELRNYMLNDPLLDWLEINSKRNSNMGFLNMGVQKFHKLIRKVKPLKSNTIRDYLMNQGNVFERIVVEKIEKKVGKNNLIRISDEKYDSRDIRGYEATIEAIKKGIPIIHGGILHNKTNNTFGVTDLLVRADYFGKIYKLNPMENDDDKKYQAPNLPKGMTHYRVIDIKYSSLPLRADGIHLLNSGRIPCYKAQLWVYNEALALIQGYNPQKSYLMGRKWSYESVKGFFNGISTFDRAGTVDFMGIDFSYTLKSAEAVQWVKDVKEPASQHWNVSTVPFTRPELYPNMSNQHEDKWHNAKLEIANSIDEITSMWMVGVKHRRNAHQKGIYKWSDKRCTPKILGIGGERVSRVISKILSVNRGKSTMIPNKIKNNIGDWKYQRKLELFVDFETISSVFTIDPATNDVSDYTTIFMIGVGHIDGDGQWIYRNFLCQSLTPSEEVRICTEFVEYVISLAKQMKCKSPKCFHWSGAEPREWNLLLERYDGRTLSKINKLTQQKYYLEWVDLLEVFKTEPIVVKGAHNFSLKSIAKAMYSHKMIKTTWDLDSSCSDGKEAMMVAVEAYKKKSPMKEPGMKDIISYNEVDVKTVQEILHYIRKRT